ncbi:tRNA (cytosine(34)-C(5))-methyltransferase, mitochondrial [Labeo rohita]|uniref:tRNA (Cytosine(34)-C(5))-methyltransferase, mitochondrial n=1 Tax=Labeo rohita TaxID=84645 RepID=A0ABQ8MZY7_LABRO|nr:tRNA (cytosine(34)-C(5))-methyltransferase, mitochondrial [Labeo rohita]
MFSTKLYCIKGFSSSPLLFLTSSKRVLSSLSHGQRTVTNTLAAQCKSKPQKQVCKTVLRHFDTQYSEELGEQWQGARDVLLNPLSWQYGVLLNRFSDLTNLKQCLTELGYTNLLPQTQPESQSQAAHIPLQCFIHRDPVRIPTQTHHPGWLKQYYLLNAASLLPVLSLNVKEGENVLDLCAAPGGENGSAQTQLATKDSRIICSSNTTTSAFRDSPGRPEHWERATRGLRQGDETLGRSVAALQAKHANQAMLKIPRTLDGGDTGTRSSSGDENSCPEIANEAHTGRSLLSFCFALCVMLTVPQVLVDAPCSNDRSWLYTPDTHQGEMWLKERTQLPLLQKELLCSALAAVRPGGVVVYSTCTMSRAENQSVVEAVLASYQGVELLEVQQHLIDSLSDHFCFAHFHSSVGQLVIPQKGKTWGPMYVSRLRRIY